PNVELSETVYFQPRFDRFSDYFLLSIFGAKFSVTSTLSTGIDLIFRRENVVPAGVKQDDVQLMNSISLTFYHRVTWSCLPASTKAGTHVSLVQRTNLRTRSSQYVHNTLKQT